MCLLERWLGGAIWEIEATPQLDALEALTGASGVRRVSLTGGHTSFTRISGTL